LRGFSLFQVTGLSRQECALPLLCAWHNKPSTPEMILIGKKLQFWDFIIDFSFSPNE
jgi:hypothetical protein